MSVKLSFKLLHTVTETLDTGVDGASNPDIIHDAYNINGTLDGTTGVPVTKTAVTIQTLAAGALTVDLTSLTGTNGATVDFTGLKVQYMAVINGTDISGGSITEGSNSAITIGAGATNGYDIFGASNNIQVKPGQAQGFFFAEKGDDVGASDKNIDVSGTGTDSFFLVLVAG